jgi:predicted RNA-binding protein with TRAM domain
MKYRKSYNAGIIFNDEGKRRPGYPAIWDSIIPGAIQGIAEGLCRARGLEYIRAAPTEFLTVSAGPIKARATVMCAELAYAAFGNIKEIFAPGLLKPGRVFIGMENGQTIELRVHVHGFNGDGEGGATGSFVILSEDVEVGKKASEKLEQFLNSVNYFNKAQASVDSFEFAKLAKIDQAIKNAFEKLKGVFASGKN